MFVAMSWGKAPVGGRMCKKKVEVCKRRWKRCEYVSPSASEVFPWSKKRKEEKEGGGDETKEAGVRKRQRGRPWAVSLEMPRISTQSFLCSAHHGGTKVGST